MGLDRYTPQFSLDIGTVRNFVRTTKRKSKIKLSSFMEEEARIAASISEVSLIRSLLHSQSKAGGAAISAVHGGIGIGHGGSEK